MAGSESNSFNLTEKQKRFCAPRRLTLRVHEKFIYKKLKALSQLTKHLSLFSERPKTVNKILVLTLFAKIHEDINLYQVVAIKELLNFYYPEWVNFASPRVLGLVTDRNDKEVAQWRKDVLLAYGKTCGKCGSTENLQAHHILPWSDFPEVRTEVSNGICLCGSCHSKEHPKMGHGMFQRAYKN